ncbi:MAG: hypothetical protein WCF23_08515 [Candidatus Nitrosopolaris sp.]
MLFMVTFNNNSLEREMKYPVTDVGMVHDHFNRVLIVGLGQLGLPVAKYAVETGFDNVYGYDVSPRAMDRAEKTAGIKKATNFSDFDVYILCVSTHKPEDISSPQVEGLLSIVDRISKEAKKDGALVSIESTVPKGTSKKIYEILNHRLHVVHAPHRWYALEEKEHGINQPRVIGGVCECCLKAGMQFYSGGSSLSSFSDIPNNKSFSSSFTYLSCSCQSLGIPMHPVSEVEIAELTKVAENAQRYLQIAFAEDLYLYSQANNINFSELRDALNTKWNVNILEPREGIGGHCLPKDTKMFLQSSSKSVRSKILTAAMEVDQDYQRHRQSRGSTSSRFEDKADTNEGKNPLLSFSFSTQQSSFNSEDETQKDPS